jgi:chromosome segregation protein
LRSDKKELQKERDKVDKESGVLGKERAKLESELEKCEDERKRVEDSIKGIEDNVTKLDSSTLTLQKEILGLNKKVDSLEEKLNKLRLDGERTKGLLETARREVAELEETKKTYEFHIQDADYTLKEIKSGINHRQKSEKKLKAEFQAKLKREKELGKESVELESAIKTLTLEYNQLKAEAEATRNVELGYTRAVSSILECRDKGTIKGIHGTLAELARVEDKYQKALNFAAGSRMQAIVVDSDEVAAKAIKFIKDKKIGRATFLPLNKMLGGRPSGKALIAVKDAMGFAIDLIKFDEKYRDAFWYALGDTIVVDKLENARKLMGGVRLVTLDGELVEKSGAMTGGAARTSMVKIGAGKKHIETVAAKLRDAVARSEKLNDELKKLKTEIMELESNLKGRELDSDSTKLGPLEAQKKEYKARLKGVVNELSAKSDKIKNLEGEVENIGKGMESLSSQLEELKNTRDAKKKSFAGFTPQAMAHKLQQEQKAKVELTEKYNGLMSQVETLKAKLDLLGEKRSELDERLKALGEQMKDHDNRLKTSRDSEKKSESELRALQKSDESADKELRDLSSRKERKYKEKVELESEKGKLLDRLHAKEDFLTNLKVDMQAAENQLKAAEEEIKNYNIEVKGKLPSAEELKKTVLETETMMNALGAVNMKALDDYDEKGKRCKELEDELAELRSQKNKLNALVRALGDKKKSGLLSVFEKINQNFKAVYSEISDGGDAELVLENMEDPFQGGLIIKAKPRNKKVMRLEALSGGEKSLVSMAFIFAIQEYEPSPFYLLDEIDQNLDALNAEKVARMIRHNSETVQFIQISLRKITLKEADHVVGVTMDEDSTSKVVMKVSLTDVPDEKIESAEEEMANAEGA